MTYWPQIRFDDTHNFDAFGRLRVSNPNAIFDAQLTYDLTPLNYEAVTNGTGATVTHDSTNRQALMTFSSTATGGKAFLQSYKYLHYQPGRSQQIYVTFVMGAAVTDVVKFAGYSDGVNGVEFQLLGSTKQFVLYSDTSTGDQTVVQSSWNLDKLDGTGPSAITLDTSKIQILVIDLQALYSGRVRVGFDINGVVVYAHEFLAANSAASPYIQSANLPIRAGMTCTGTVSATMNFICATVQSEGGSESPRGQTFTIEGATTAGNGSRTHILSVRPKTTFNSITNRIDFVLDKVDIVVTGNSPVLWELCIGQAITGTTTYSDVNGTYSAFAYNTAGTISGSPALVIDAGYCAATAVSSQAATFDALAGYPISLDAAGAVRALGTLSVIVTGIGAASACRVSLGWREVR